MDKKLDALNYLIDYLELDPQEYMKLKEYIFSKQYEMKLIYSNKEFLLTHYLSCNRYSRLKHLPDMRTKNKYVIYGHEPIGKIHSEISNYNFNFNYMRGIY